jgi:hypothetical protein
MSKLNRFPTRRFYGQSMQTQLGFMLIHRKIQNLVLDQSEYRGRRVLGYKLPDWQRAEVWTDIQCIKFIESIWLGVVLGSFMVNLSASGNDDDTHMVLLDGQQRLQAIERYWADEFLVKGDDGKEYLWSDLVDAEHAHFMRIPFPWICTGYGTDGELRAAYNRHNFGGTAHVDGQEA